MQQNANKNAEIRKKLEAFGSNPSLAQFIVTMNLQDKLDEVKTAIENIPKVEIPDYPEYPEIDLSPLSEKLDELLNKEVVDMAGVVEVLEKLSSKLEALNEPIEVEVKLDIV